jgi:hypothetical protein
MNECWRLRISDWLHVFSRLAGRRGVLWLGTAQQTRGGPWMTPLSGWVSSEANKSVPHANYNYTVNNILVVRMKIIYYNLLFAQESIWAKKGWSEHYKMDLREIRCQERRWMELAQDCVQWRALILALLNLQMLSLFKMYGIAPYEGCGRCT